MPARPSTTTFALSALVLAFLFCPTQKAPAQKSASSSIKEEAFVPIGGIDQWITIKGTNRDNPVILFLHGGPGDALSPIADSMYAGWDNDFTLVQWDQRGAGRTYTKSGPSMEATMTVERMAQDGIEVAEFLTKHLHKKKVILFGESWGSVLGISMAHKRPDLFYAYVGVAQMVNWQADLAASYRIILERATASGDQQAIATLTSLGAPPWHVVSNWPKFRKVEKAYQAKAATAPPAPQETSPEYASPKEQEQYEAADEFSFEHFWGMTLSGPFTKVDLPSLGTQFAIPIFLIQGQEDLTAVPEVTKAYFETIKAPHKQFYLVPGAGHEDSVPELALTLKVLREQVRPLTRSGQPKILPPTRSALSAK